MTIELYAFDTPNGRKISGALEEMALPYSVRIVDIGKGQQFEPGFLAISPNNKIPAIVDPEGPEGRPVSVFESGAILLYLAEKTGLFWPADMRQRSVVFQWLMFQMGGIGPMSGQFVHFTRAAPAEGNDYARARYATEVRRLYGVLDRRLAGAPYLAGDDYSLADIATWPWARLHEMLRLDFADFPNLARWVDDIAARPAAHRAVLKEAEIRPLDGAAFQDATPDQLDRFFARGKYAAGPL
jgi:GST-like protein